MLFKCSGKLYEIGQSEAQQREEERNFRNAARIGTGRSVDRHTCENFMDFASMLMVAMNGNGVMQRMKERAICDGRIMGLRWQCEENCRVQSEIRQTVSRMFLSENFHN